MKIRFIINPVSGTGKQKGIEKTISNYFKNYEIFYTEKTGDAEKLCANAVDNNIGLVIAVGGDGTINECLKPLINSKTCLGIIPCGSGNGFAFHIGMRRNIREALNQLNNSSIERVDVCSVNGAHFINVSGVGFDAHIAELFSKLEKRGFINYIKLIFRELSYKPMEYDIKYNEIKRKIKAYMISFANASQYGNDAKISPQSDIKDGLIDFVIVKDFPKWQIPFFLFKIMTGKVHLSNYVEIIKSDNMEICTTKSLVHLDGEPYKTNSPLNITLSNSINILMPNEKK